MTQEEYEREQAELQRLINEYNSLVNRKNQLVAEYNALLAELEYSINATADAIQRAAVVREYVVPKLGTSASSVTEVAELVGAVEAEIEELSRKYFIVKNISTATKKLTQLNNEYQRNFGLYNTLRRVCLGYVVGIDSNIISNERLRLTVEKNYLQNADYWISHCLMATMLWVSNEKEAAERAVAKAMSIDERKSSLFFLLINLRFGRAEAAAKWFELYINDVDVNNVGDEIRILLQAYLYNVCGDDAEFKKRIGEEFDQLLALVKNGSQNFEGKIRARVMEVINSYAHKSAEEFIELQRSSSDYQNMMRALDSAEKNIEFAKYFNAILESDVSAPKDLSSRIENVLYDLINTYDEAEMQIMRSMDYNEMIIQAKGDVAAAQKMYNTKYRSKKVQTLGDLMVRLAFPSGIEEVDIRVRKFAVSFLCESIMGAFAEYKKQYAKFAKETHEVTVDGFKVNVNEKRPDDAVVELRNQYKKNRNRFISQDKGVKALTVFTILFWVAWIGSSIYAAVSFASNGGFNAVSIILFVATFLAAVGFTIWLIFRRRKVGEKVANRMDIGMEKLRAIIKCIADWRAKYTAADEASAVLQDVLKKFITEEEGK